MTDVGEAISVDIVSIDDPVCVICGEKHKDAKEEEITDTAISNLKKWSRNNQSFKNVFDSDGTRNTIYPGNKFPPVYGAGFDWQGHHCVALSKLVDKGNTSAPKDRNKKLNYYLNKVGFYPNRPSNIIGLPKRGGYGDFTSFHLALDKDKPLQMHGPGHDKEYFHQVDRLIGVINSLMTEPGWCAQVTQEDWEDDMKKIITWAENYAFKQMAKNDGAWRLHPNEQVVALKQYFLSANSTMEIQIKAAGNKEQRAGLGASKKEITFPIPKLDTGVFE